MNFLRRAKSSLRSLLPRGGGDVIGGTGLFSKTKTIPRSPEILASRSRFSSPIHRPVIACGDFRRFYYAERVPVQHFRRRSGPRWYQNPRNLLAVVIVGGGIAVTVYSGNLETVPYTKRKHLVLLSPEIERQLGEAQFHQLKSALRSKILPSIHPDSIRVRLIAKEIIEALQRGLHHQEPRWSDMNYASSSDDFPDDERSREKIMGLGGGEIEGKWSRADETLDEVWVQESRKNEAAPATKHLEGLNWEVIVVRDGMVNAFCLPGGKIVVFTGLLEHFRTDAEIATIIGHEVAHAIARHVAEGITKNLWVALLQLILLQFVFMPDVISTMSNLLLKLPFSRRMEMEADYVGLLLLASAGYDPRVAPKVYEKLGQITGGNALQDYLSTHPSSKKRAMMLSQANVMEEAISIYRQAITGRGVEGFL